MIKSIRIRIVVSFLLLTLIALVDANISSEITFAALYLIPLVIFANQEQLPFRYTIIMAIIIPGIWATIDYFHHFYTAEWHHILNTLIKIIFSIFVVIGIRQYKQLKKARLDLLISNQELNKFIGMAAHDVRNPIGSILMSTELILEDETLSRDTKNWIEIIQLTAKNTLDIVSDTLSISKIQSGTLELNFENFEYKSYLLDIIRLNQLHADKKGQQIILETDVNKVLVKFDKSRISQVLNNLLTNAIKYSKNNTKILVQIELVELNKIKTSIKDEGLGIDEKYHDKIFNPFTTTNNIPTNNESKTGLGLAIVKKIIELHHGEIGFKSKVGQGSTFFFTLPV